MLYIKWEYVFLYASPMYPSDKEILHIIGNEYRMKEYRRRYCLAVECDTSFANGTM